MKKIYFLILIALAILNSQNGFSQNDTILIDFGAVSTSSLSPWNNLNDVMGAGEINQLKNSSNLVTGMGINVFDRFNGINTTGTTTPNASLNLPVSATTDNYYGSIATFSGQLEPQGAMQITGLNPAKTYEFIIFASRAGVSDNREAKYKFVGFTTDSVYLDASNNTGNTVSAIVTPKADGTIDLWVSPGENNNNPTYKFYYIGALKMVYEHEAALPPGITLVSPNGGEVWDGGSTHALSWTSFNLVEDIIISYSPDNGANWLPIATVASTEHPIDWVLPATYSNQYLVKITSSTASDVSDLAFTIQDPNDAILIDFGGAATASPSPWNNFTDVMGAGLIPQLTNSRNLITGMGLNIFDRFNGINYTGTTTPNAALSLPATATSDNFYGSVSLFSGQLEPEAGMKFTGLNPAKTYHFSIFASRTGVTDNRETKYKFIANTTDSVYLNTSNNTSNVATASFQPKADGTIDVWVSPGENNNNPTYKFYYLGAITMSYEREAALPANITLVSPNGGEGWLAGSTQTVSWTSQNLTDDVVVSYSIDNGANWVPITTVPGSQQSIEWILPGTPSNHCLVKLASGATTDVSESVFTILDPVSPSITLLTPGTGEHWIIGSKQKISWSSTSLSENIGIQYSTDNGNNWEAVATVASTQTSYKWTIPDTPSVECLIRINSGIYADTSKTTFTILAAQCSKTIVVLGSSTAYGTGTLVADSAWVKRYTAALKNIDPEFNVVNLALGGYVTYKILPTGTPMPSGVIESIDVARNVTKALTYSPYAIIVNMPSNDAVKYYTVEMQMANYEIIRKYANAQGVNVWFSTTQPRYFTDPVQINIQKNMAVAVMETYGVYGIDFWTRTATAGGFILSQYDSGDGAHLNNTGHRILFEEVFAKQIDTLACLSTALKAEKAKNIGIRAYPNPFNNHSVIEFESTSAGKVEVSFMDITGRQVGFIEKAVSGSGMQNISVSKDQITSASFVIYVIVTIKDQSGTKQGKVKLIRMNNN